MQAKHGGPYGNLPENPTSYIQNKFRLWASQGANSLLEHDEDTEQCSSDDLEKKSTSELKQLYKERFDEDPTETNILIRILHIDDSIKFGGSEEKYNTFNKIQLKNECIDREIDIQTDKKQLIIVHRMFESRKRVTTNDEISRSLAVTEAAAILYSNDD